MPQFRQGLHQRFLAVYRLGKTGAVNFHLIKMTAPNHLASASIRRHVNVPIKRVANRLSSIVCVGWEGGMKFGRGMLISRSPGPQNDHARFPS